MDNLCKNHKFGYEPLRLIASKNECPLCFIDKIEQLQAELEKLKKLLSEAQRYIRPKDPKFLEIAQVLKDK